MSDSGIHRLIEDAMAARCEGITIVPGRTLGPGLFGFRKGSVEVCVVTAAYIGRNNHLREALLQAESYYAQANTLGGFPIITRLIPEAAEHYNLSDGEVEQLIWGFDGTSIDPKTSPTPAYLAGQNLRAQCLNEEEACPSNR